MDKCDVLLTYEIKNREIENLCLVKRELERRGYSVRLKLQYETFFQTEEPIDAKVVVVPAYYRPRAQFYAASHTVKTERIVNMMWEQVFGADEEDRSDVLCSIKPWGRSAVHLAWGKHMQDRLMKEWGVAEDHARVTGQIALDFLRGPLRNYYDSREEVFARYHVPADKRVHLFISSLAYAGASARVMRNYSADGDMEKPLMLADVSVRTREALVKWFERVLEENEGDVIIYRPHPEERSSELLRDLAARQPRFLVIGEESIKQWILICDKIYSWMSTAIAEVYAAGKGCAILRPVEVPYVLDIKMYHEAKQVTTYEQFREVFVQPEQTMAVEEKKLRNYYDISENCYAYERVCDVIEDVMHDEKFRLNPPMKNPLIGGGAIIERIKNVIKRAVAGSKLMEKVYQSDMLQGGKFRELLDDVFYVKAKLKKNYTSEEEIDAIMRRIDRAFAAEK